jgi:hypothetical protein
MYCSCCVRLLATTKNTPVFLVRHMWLFPILPPDGARTRLIMRIRRRQSTMQWNSMEWQEGFELAAAAARLIYIYRKL